MAGIALSSGGIAVARVLQQPAQAPVLASCEFVDVPVARQEQALASLVREQRLTDCCCASVVDHRDFSLLLVEAPQVGPTD